MSAPQPGFVESVGPYRLIRAIGAGGSARIDLARIDRAYGFVRHVVVKRPLEHLRGDSAVNASLRREARIGGQLRHPNLVAVLDAGTHDGYDYLALEYIHGTSLRDLMHAPVSGQVRSVPLAVAVEIVIDIARGLHEAHELEGETGEPLGLVHRDVSPGNVLLGLDGAVKVADFGIAKETRVSTLSGSMNGTVTYMAPEQCRGHAIDRRADEWALGVILYELVTKQRLFLADNDVASLHRVLSGQITRPRKLDPNVPGQLEEIIMTALAQDPENRFASTRELATSLEVFAANHALVLGARGVARTIEEVVGPRSAPWIARPPSTDAEPSLVEVIANEIEVDPEPLIPTFGPTDERASEDGLLPLASPPRRKIGLMIGVATAIVGVGLGTAVALHKTPSARLRSQPTVPAITMPTVTGPVRPPDVVEEVESEPPTSEPKPAVRHHHRPHVTNPVAAGSNAVVPPPSPPAAVGSGSAHIPVEWKPSLLLPTDRADTSKKP